MGAVCTEVASSGRGTVVEGSLLTGKQVVKMAVAASLLSEVGGARGGIEQGGRTSKHPCTEASMKSGETLALSLYSTACNCLDWIVFGWVFTGRAWCS